MSTHVLLGNSMSPLPSTSKAFKQRFSEECDYDAPSQSRHFRHALKFNKLKENSSCTLIWFAPSAACYYPIERKPLDT